MTESSDPGFFSSCQHDPDLAKYSEEDIRALKVIENDCLSREIDLHCNEPKRAGATDQIKDSIYTGNGLLKLLTQAGLESFTNSDGLQFTHSSPRVDKIVWQPPVELDDMETFCNSVHSFLESDILNTFFTNDGGGRNRYEISRSWLELKDMIPKEVTDLGICSPKTTLEELLSKAKNGGLEESYVQLDSTKHLIAQDPDFSLKSSAEIMFDSRKTVEARLREMNELLIAVKNASLKKDDFVICLRPASANIEAFGITEEEERLPFMLCQVQEDYESNINRDTMISVKYWRQPEGNINKPFIPGVVKLMGKSAKFKNRPWIDTIPRSSVLIHNPTFLSMNNNKKTRRLTAVTKRMIPELYHTQLQGWVFKNNELVFISPENRVENVKIGGYLIVLMKDVPNSVKDKLRSGLQECPFMVGRVIFKPKPTFQGAAPVSLGLEWLASESGDPNDAFVALVDEIK